ncbi:MAG: hypothetical protein N2114_04725 [Candidatus Goldbacteria bacterium]|nr:hypothetical protein [Candidatus Goldiibacteriota bacterium]
MMNIYYKIFILVFLNGFTSIITQIVLYKEILSQVYANEIVLCFALSSWLIAGAFGGMIIFPKYLSNRSDNFLFIGLGFIPVISAIISLFSLLIIRNIKTFLNIPVEQLMNIWDAMIITILFYGIPAFFLTLTFCFAGEVLKRYGGDNRLLYILETAGAVISGVLFTLFLNGKYTNLELLYWIGLINIIVVYILYREKADYAKKINITLVFILIVYLIPLPTDFLRKIDSESFNKPYHKYNIVSKKEGFDSKVVITEKENVYYIFSNGTIKYQYNNPEFAEFLGWVMLTYEGYKNVLLVNNVYTGGVEEIQKYKDVEKITAVETDQDLAEILINFFRNSDYGKKVRFVHGDLIYYLYQMKNDDKYDIVILNMSAPNTLLNNRNYTYEFFKLLKRYLKNTGRIIFSMPASENYFSREIILSIAPVYNTLKDVFLNVEVIPGDKIIFLASDGEIKINSVAIMSNMKKNNIKIAQLNPVYIEDKLNKSIKMKNLLNELKINLNKILKPEAYMYNIKKDLLMFYNNLNFIKMVIIIFIFLLIFFQFINLKKNKTSIFSYLSMFLFAVTTITLELCLILVYQSFYGYLYRTIGLLYSFFMVGILIGAITLMIFNEINFRLTVIFAEILNLIILFYIINFKNIDQPINPNIIMFFIIASGFFVGAIFNLMLKNSNISILYGADLAGGAIGGILFGLVVFPIFGFIGTIIFNLLLLTIVYIGDLKNVSVTKAIY